MDICRNSLGFARRNPSFSWNTAREAESRLTCGLSQSLSLLPTVIGGTLIAYAIQSPLLWAAEPGVRRHAMEFRLPEQSDWHTIFDIANASVADVDGAGIQQEWLANRQEFAASGPQHHFVCLDSGIIVGYGSAERGSDVPDNRYRLFVVATPDRLESAGRSILDRLLLILDDLDAGRSYFVEYATDQRLVRFLLDRGYTESGTFKLDSGIDAVILEREHGDVG